MPAYMTISIGENALDAMPIMVSTEDRLVRAALDAVHTESARMVGENWSATAMSVTDGVAPTPWHPAARRAGH